MSPTFMALAAIGLIILLLLYRTSSKAAIEGFNSLPQPDLCSDFNATDCKMAAGCAYCSATGLCLNANRAVLCTSGYLAKEVIDSFTSEESSPLAGNTDTFLQGTA